MTTIAIDGFNISLPQGSGIATYARNLNQAVRGLGHQTDLIFGPPRLRKDPILAELDLFDAPTISPTGWPRPGAMLGYLTSPFGRTLRRVAAADAVITRQIAPRAPDHDAIWACADLFHTANRGFAARRRFTPVTFDRAAGPPPDLVHWTCPLPLRANGRPNLYTIHDLVPLRLPFTTLDNKRNFLALCRKIVRTADAIATVSETSRQDIIRLLQADPERVHVTYQAVATPAELTARAESDLAHDIEATFGLGWRDYFLFFGAIEPKKNLPRVIEAYLASGAKSPLVIVGANGWLVEDELRLLYPDLIERQILEATTTRRSDRVRRYAYLPWPLLARLIRGAKAVLAPFLYEGFGLPILEAMQIGTPVLTANTGSSPEVAGDAAILVDPYDTDAIRAGIKALDADEALRADLTGRGVRQAEQFSHAAYQARLAKFYRPFL